MVMQNDLVNPCAAVLFTSIFHSFKAGIMTQFAAAKDEKIFMQRQIGYEK